MGWTRIAVLTSLACLMCLVNLKAHDAHGRSNAPPEARRLKNPLSKTESGLQEAQVDYARLCVGCHGEDGRARTSAAAKLAYRPTDLAEYAMESMKDGEIFWVVKHGIDGRMDAFDKHLDDRRIWQLVFHVRALRDRQHAAEKARLGPYEWHLPAGFPFPNVPPDNPMTEAKVELGRRLFYDRRLSLNQSQSCATCHRQDHAFADARGQGLGSTGERHPRGPLSLANVAYNPVLTWANPNLRRLEQQALVPMFGEHPVELGFSGKEDLLLARLRAVPLYRKMFSQAFPEEKDPFLIRSITKAIASFERTILSGDSPYDEYRRGDDPDAISSAAKRGEALFFSENLECFHCHGGFNFTGTVDYLGKGIAEVEFHNTGLYNLPGRHGYPEANLGLYEFTHQEEDAGKFKAPTLRNIALTAPYMHDGSVKTLEDAIDHYKHGGRRIMSGPLAGNGADNPNKSEFVKPLELTDSQKHDLLEFLRSLTDGKLLTNPNLSNPWLRPSQPVQTRIPRYILHGEVVQVFAEDGAVALYHDEVAGLMSAAKRPNAMEFLVEDKAYLRTLKPGMKVSAAVTRRGSDYLLEPTSNYRSTTK